MKNEETNAQPNTNETTWQYLLKLLGIKQKIKEKNG